LKGTEIIGGLVGRTLIQIQCFNLLVGYIYICSSQDSHPQPHRGAEMVGEIAKRKRGSFLLLPLMLTILLCTNPCGATSSIFKSNVRHLPFPCPLGRTRLDDRGHFTDGTANNIFNFHNVPLNLLLRLQCLPSTF